MNYTKGPWTVFAGEGSTNIENETETIAFDVANDNASLIAAVPEMYEFCKMLKDHGVVLSGGSLTDYKLFLDEVLKKAEGK
jgi:hypothetical protein